MKWKHFYSLLQRTQTETSLGQILGHFLNKYTSALYAFQHVGHKHVSVYSFMPFLLQPATVSFADWGQKGVFQLSAMTPWYFPYLTDLMLKLFQCTKSWRAFLHRAFKEKQNKTTLNFFCCHLVVQFYMKLCWVPFHLHWLKRHLCHQHVAWSFCSLTVFSNSKKCDLQGTIWRILRLLA